MSALRKTDRELLVLAAKAAGYDVRIDGNTIWRRVEWHLGPHSGISETEFRPLYDVCEATCLAKDLGMWIDFHANSVGYFCGGELTRYVEWGSPETPDFMHAIVRAAAQLAESRQEGV